nr:unnamed protein product [Callosobruchus chinensis]
MKYFSPSNLLTLYSTDKT